MGFQPGDSLVCVLPNNAERTTIQLGAAYAGVNLWVLPVVSLTATDHQITKETLGGVLSQSNARGIIVGHGSNLISILRETLLEALQKMDGDMRAIPMVSKEFPKLKYLLHTGAQKEPFIYRFRDILGYYPVPDPLEETAAAVNPTMKVGEGFVCFQSLLTTNDI